MLRGELAPRLKQDLAEVLVRERERLRRSVRLLNDATRALGQSQAEEGSAVGDPADVASDLAEEELDLTLELAEQARMAEVEAALKRLTHGGYAKCQRCGAPIEIERLYALPWARHCLHCAWSGPTAGVRQAVDRGGSASQGQGPLD